MPRIGPGAVPVVLATAVAVGVLVVAVVALRAGRPPERPGGSPAVVYRGYISSTYAAGGSLYGITPDRPDSPSVSTPPHLVRIDPRSGRVVARRLLAPPPTPRGQPVPEPEQILLAGGSLWASATDSQQTWLWRLEPRSLAVRRLTVLPGGGVGQTGSLAVAGGWLWVVNKDTLVRVSLTTGRVTGSRVISRALVGDGNGVAADASGRTLVVAATGRTTGWHVELLNLRSGAPIASSATFSGAVRDLAGVLDGGVWINPWAGGAVRLDLRTLKVTAAVGPSSLAAQAFDGIVAVGAVQHAATGCIDPISARMLAPLPNLVAADGATAYVQRQRGGTPEIRQQTLDPRCRATP
jgi:hypothetical protein